MPFLGNLKVIDLTYYRYNIRYTKRTLLLCDDFLEFLNQSPSDEDILTLFQRVRINQTNGMQIKQAITHTLKTFSENTDIVFVPNKSSPNNTVSFLVNKYRAIFLQFRAEGYGYGVMAKMLAKRGVYNKDTGKAYSRATIQRVCNLLEQKGKM